MSGDIALIGAVDDVHGLDVGVYQDRGNVRVSVGDLEVTFDVAGLARYVALLRDAALEARMWELGQDDPDELTEAYIADEELPPGAQDAGWAAYWATKPGFRDGE